MNLEHRMYLSLRSMPSRCTRVWDKRYEGGFRTTKVCSRCQCIQDYEDVHPDEPNPLNPLKDLNKKAGVTAT